ncbi:MAG: MFS transporter [Thermoplasmata archaeon]|nr:MFS transporter [Candidatus Sysuiplasma jiujiangense]MBX8640974.1 MFS transporter [Candidatus Sysuiplasma jiujiangense]
MAENLMRGEGSFSWNLTILATTSAAHFINDGESAIFPVLLPPLAYYVSGSFELAAVVTCFYLFSSFASPVAVSATKNRGQIEKGMGEGLTILGAGIAAMGISISMIQRFGMAAYVGVVLSACLAGFGSSYYHPIGSSVVQNNFPENKLGLALGLNGSAGSLGRSLFLTLSVAAFVLEKLYGGLIILGAACIVAALPMEIYFSRKSHLMPSADKTAAVKRTGIRDSARLTKEIWPLLAMSIIRNLESTGVVLYLPTFFIEEGIIHYGINLGLTMTAIMALPIAGQIIVGLVSDRIGRVKTLFLTTLISGIFVLLFLLYPYNIYLDVVTLGFFSLAAFSGFPILFPIATHMVSGDDRYLGSSLAWMSVGLGSAMSPLIIVLLSERWVLGSLYASFAALAAATTAASLLCFTGKIRNAGRAEEH